MIALRALKTKQDKKSDITDIKAYKDDESIWS